MSQWNLVLQVELNYISSLEETKPFYDCNYVSITICNRPDTIIFEWLPEPKGSECASSGILIVELSK